MVLLALLTFLGLNLHADDSARLQMNSLYLQSGFTQTESLGGGFRPLSGRISGTALFSPQIEALVEVGSSDVLYRPYWAPTMPQTLSFHEFKGTYHFAIGDVYAGQVRVPVGWEGTQDARELTLPRSLLFEKGYLPLYDTGAGFYSSYRGFYMNILAHQGEGAAVGNTDNRMFVTGHWGVRGGGNSNLGLSISTGRFLDSSFKENRVRAGTLFFGFNLGSLALQVDATYLRLFEPVVTTDKFFWHADGILPISSNLNLVTRYEQYVLDANNNGVTQSRLYFGGELKTLNESSRLFLYYVKNDEPESIANDEVQLLWRIIPPID